MAFKQIKTAASGGTSSNAYNYYTGVSVSQSTGTLTDPGPLTAPEMASSVWGMPYLWNTQSNGLRNQNQLLGNTEQLVAPNRWWNSSFETGGAFSANDSIWQKQLYNSGSRIVSSNFISGNQNLWDNGNNNSWVLRGHMAPITTEVAIIDWLGTSTTTYNAQKDTGQEYNFIHNRLARNHVPCVAFEEYFQIMSGPVTATSAQLTTSYGLTYPAESLLNDYSVSTTYSRYPSGWTEFFQRSYADSSTSTTGSDWMYWTINGLVIAFVCYTYQSGEQRFYILARLENGDDYPIGIKNNFAIHYSWSDSGAGILSQTYDQSNASETYHKSTYKENRGSGTDFYTIIRNDDWHILGIQDDHPSSYSRGFSSWDTVNNPPKFTTLDSAWILSFYPMGTDNTNKHIEWGGPTSHGGNSIATCNGKTIIGGANYYDEVNSYANSGAVAIYDANNLGALQGEEIIYLNRNNPNHAANDRFGQKVAACGQWAAISAPGAGTYGRVYLRNLYRPTSSIGTAAQDGPNNGAPENPLNSFYTGGLSSTNFTQSGWEGIVPALTDSGSVSQPNNVYSGWGARGLSFNYGKLVMGNAYTYGPGTTTSNGAVVIYDVDDLTGRVSNEKRLFLNDVADYEDYNITNGQFPGGEGFGTSVSVGCGRIVVGAPFMDYCHKNDNGVFPTPEENVTSYGAAFLYDLDGGFIKRLHVPESVMYPNGTEGYSNNNDLGLTVAIGSGVIAVGAGNNYFSSLNGQLGPIRGNVYIFDLDGNYMFDLRSKYEATVYAREGYRSPDGFFHDTPGFRVHKIDNPISMSDAQATGGGSRWTADSFGHSLSIGFGKIVVGVPNFEHNENEFVGAVMVFDLNGKLITAYSPYEDADSAPNVQTGAFGDSVFSGYGKILITDPKRALRDSGTVSGYPSYGVYAGQYHRPSGWNVDSGSIRNSHTYFIGTNGAGGTRDLVDMRMGCFYSVESDPIMTPWDLLEIENGWR